MKASPEQISIVRTVINEFLPVADNPGSAEKASRAVLEYVEGNSNKATARCDLRNAFTEIGQRIDDQRLELCVDTAHSLVFGYQDWLARQETLRLDLERFAEMNKEDEIRALETVIEEVKEWPEVIQGFRDAFALLKRRKTGKPDAANLPDQTKSNQIKPDETLSHD